jgi:hypothetical protein
MNYEIFENINYDNILNLFKLCKENQNNLNNVKINYSRYNSHIRETLNFLVELDVIEIEKNNVKIKVSNSNLQEALFDNLLKNPIYCSLIQKYFKHFTNNNNNNFVFIPNEKYNITTSSLRNFLISMNIIKFDIINNIYVLLNPNILSKIKRKIFSPEQLEKKLAIQNQIGLLAEKLIFQKEIKKLKTIDINLVPDHVSLNDVSAGYDIKSYIKKNNEICEIFIEVKAVASSNYKFHLSVDEYQTALEFGNKYYIYLLPVDYSNSEHFDYEKILMINDIDKNIINKNPNWICENDGFLIYKKISK